MEKVVDKKFDFRYERKFVIEDMEQSHVESIIRIHPAMFAEIYAERSVNNIYFDTVDLKHYRANLDGVAERVKPRIRWYGNVFGLKENSKLELKLKRGLLGSKESYVLPAFELEKNVSPERVKEIWSEADLPDGLHSELLNLSPTLLNSYRRKYYMSQDGRFRITLDFDMEFYSIRSGFGHLAKMPKIHNRVVLELKYAEGYDDFASEITQYLPVRMSKSSKYVTGLESVILS